MLKKRSRSFWRLHGDAPQQVMNGSKRLLRRPCLSKRNAVLSSLLFPLPKVGRIRSTVWAHARFLGGSPGVSLQFVKITLLFPIMQGDGFAQDCVLSQVTH